MDRDMGPNGAGDGPTVIEENGSFRLVARNGRYAVVEARAGQVFGLPADKTGGRDGAADNTAGVEAVAHWTGEGDARALMRHLSARGDQLARDIR